MPIKFTKELVSEKKHTEAKIINTSINTETKGQHILNIEYKLGNIVDGKLVLDKESFYIQKHGQAFDDYMATLGNIFADVKSAEYDLLKAETGLAGSVS